MYWANAYTHKWDVGAAYIRDFIVTHRGRETAIIASDDVMRQPIIWIIYVLILIGSLKNLSVKF